MPMRSISKIALLCTWLGLSACTSVLMNTPVSKKDDGWIVTLGEVKDGPDEYIAEGGVAVNPGNGERLIWALVTVHNESAQDPSFSYDSCVLDGKQQVCRPVAVDRHTEIPSAADRTESIEPGQEHTRLLIYSLAKEERPARLRCGKIALPIPSPR